MVLVLPVEDGAVDIRVVVEAVVLRRRRRCRSLRRRRRRRRLRSANGLSGHNAHGGDGARNGRLENFPAIILIMVFIGKILLPCTSTSCGSKGPGSRRSST